MGQIAEFFVKITGDSSQLNKELDKVKGNLQKTSGMSVLSFAAIAGAVYKAGQSIKELADETEKYALQVHDMSLITGDSTESTSMLIQAADDARISYEQLTTAMRMAVKQGIDPSLDGMMKLADQYNAIQNPIERSQMLIETFGRSGLAMGKMMEMGSAGIKASADEARKLGLVLSPKAVQDAQNYHDAIDKLSDSFNGLKTSVGGELLPHLTTVANVVNGAIDSFITISSQLDIFKEHAEKSNPALQSFAESMGEVVKTSTPLGSLVDSFGELYSMLVDQGWIKDYTKATEDLGEATDTTAGFTWELDDATRGYTDTLPEYISLITGAKTSLDGYILDLIAARRYIDGITDKVAVITIITKYLNESGVWGSVVGFDNKGAPVISVGGKKTNAPLTGINVPPPKEGSATGGYLSGGYLVGERGPEVMTPSSQGYIAPNDTANINLSDSSIEKMARAIGNQLLMARA